MKIKNYEFIQTCTICPEQYDVFDENDNQVGYVRLRWGSLYAQCPYVGGVTVYSVDLDHDGGSFCSDEERTLHLNAIAEAISRHYILGEKIETVGDLIGVLQKLPQDAKISYDYGLELRIDEFEDGFTIG